MSKLKCKCGHIISDVEYPSPTEGEILSEINKEVLFSQIGGTIAEFMNEKEHGNSVEWLREHLGKDYPIDATTQEIVYDLMGNIMQKMVISVAECVTCGRLHVQKAPGINEYISYIPYSGKAESILNQDIKL